METYWFLQFFVYDVIVSLEVVHKSPFGLISVLFAACFAGYCICS